MQRLGALAKTETFWRVKFDGGLTDNAQRCSDYVYRATGILFKWLNRKSQRKAYTWEQFNQALRLLDWPTVTIRKDLNPCRRAKAY